MRVKWFAALALAAVVIGVSHHLSVLPN